MMGNRIDYYFYQIARFTNIYILQMGSQWDSEGDLTDQRMRVKTDEKY